MRNRSLIRRDTTPALLVIILSLNLVTSFVFVHHCSTTTAATATTSNVYPYPLLGLHASSNVNTNVEISSTQQTRKKYHHKSRSTTKRVNKVNDNIERQIVKLGRSGRTYEALDLYHKEIQVRPTVKLMNLAIDCCARARPTQLNTALQIFKEGTRGSSSLQLQPNVFTFGALMSACARARDASRALKLLDIMESGYKVKPNVVVYGTVMSACERSNPVRYTTVLELLQRAIDDETVTTSTILFNTAMSACSRAGHYQQAIKLINEMEQKYGVSPDEVSYATIMAACERCGEWHEVLHYADLCEESFNLDGVACSSALKACQQLALAERAIGYLDRMKHLKGKNVDQRLTQGWKRR